ncbi:MAG: hypothetical protein KA015_05030 [Spirochaetes bacterium]|nr:hypothetical protein [Spirochaetota bacterium]
MDVLISIKPKYVDKIINGSKKIEYRKILFKASSVNKIYVYSSFPVKKIIGYFKYDGFICNSPELLWSLTESISGISKEFFFNYFKNKSKAYGLFVNNFYQFIEPIDPYIVDNNFKPPQSFMYIEEDFLIEDNRNMEQIKK